MAETTPLELGKVQYDLPMTATETAQYLAITVDSLAKLIKEDPTLPVHRLGHGPKAHRRFFRSEVDAWLRSRWNLHETSGNGAA